MRSKLPSPHRLTLHECGTCGHRHKLVIKMSGQTSFGKCWLCTCAKYKWKGRYRD